MEHLTKQGGQAKPAQKAGRALRLVGRRSRLSFEVNLSAVVELGHRHAILKTLTIVLTTCHAAVLGLVAVTFQGFKKTVCPSCQAFKNMGRVGRCVVNATVCCNTSARQCIHNRFPAVSVGPIEFVQIKALSDT